MGNEQYIGYQAMLASVTTGIAQLEGVCKRLSMDGHADELKEIEERLKNHIFSVGIMGEFRRGKSTVINALLGQNIVPADIVPCSATLNYVKWDLDKGAEIFYKDGRVQRIAVEDLSKYVTKITRESEEVAATVEKAIVYYPCQFCQNGVQIIDTPGLNDDERMSEISEKVIPTLDAIIMVIVPDSPFGLSEAEFVRNKVMASDLGRIVFIVNKIDTVDEDDRERLLSSIRERIRSSVLDKMAKVYGRDSEEYRGAADKLGEIRLLPVSAKRALKGKMKNDPGLYNDSGYPEFEGALSQLLTEERGILELMHPVNQIVSTCAESQKIIETRLSAINMEAEDFERNRKDALEKLKETRSRKKAEVDALRNKGETLYSTLLPSIGEIYDELESELTSFVDSYDLCCLTPENRETFSNQISSEIDAKMRDILSTDTERLLYRIQEQLGKDVKGLENFGNEFNETLQDIRVGLTLGADGTGSILKDSLIDMGGIYAASLLFGAALPGIGALVAGFRDYGLKGAVVGGATGAAAGLLTGSLALTMGVVGLPLVLIMGAAATFGGKGVTRLLFGRGNKPAEADKIRSAMLAAVTKMMSEFRSSGSLEGWLKETCETSYNSIANDIDREWENSLANMENTLTQIKIDLEMNAANKQKKETDLREYASEIADIIETVKPIRERLAASLS